MTALIIDETIKQGVSKLIKYAKANRYTIAKLKAVMEGRAPPPGDQVFRLETIPLEVEEDTP